jgi:hydroxypyruvate isomerase
MNMAHSVAESVRIWPITTIVFDVGGVLVEDFIERKIADLAARHGCANRMDDLRRACAEIRPLADHGEISEAVFWVRLLLRIGVEADAADLANTAYFRAIPGVLPLVAKLRESGYTLAVLSNDSRELASERRRYFGYDALFAEIVISSAHGVTKPDPAIYRILIERLRVPAENCLFIDDRAENIAAAQACGMQAIQFHNRQQMLDAMRTMGIRMDCISRKISSSSDTMNRSICLEMFYTDRPFIERLAAARADGAQSFEMWDFRDKDPDQLKAAMRQTGMRLVNMSGNRLTGMLDPVERADFLAEVRSSAQAARQFGCPRLMLLTQPLAADGSARPLPAGSDPRKVFAELVQCGIALGALADELDFDFVIEPLNDRVDHPGYFLVSSAMAFDLIRKVNHPRVKLLYDIYHLAAMGENVLADIAANLDLIGHFHVADTPRRTEPGSGTIGYRAIFALLAERGYFGEIGYECYPGNGDSGSVVRGIFS